MKILIVSTSLTQHSRSERLAKRCLDVLNGLDVQTQYLSLKDYPLPPFDGAAIQDDLNYQFLHAAVSSADGLVLASPVYNWSSCAELKKFIEHIGSTDSETTGAFYDKVITFVHASGLPHSYMAVAPLATSLMLDFKCIINPYFVYAHNRHWENEELSAELDARIKKSMEVMVELTTLLAKRNYSSTWSL